MQNSFFTGVALEFWRRAMNPEQTRIEADFLCETLQCPTGGRLLDVPCGNGRHAIEIAKRRYLLTGVDSSEEYIEEARAAMSAVEWLIADMRELPWTERFDGGYCCGNSFAVLDANGARDFLKAVRSALKPGARFVLDTGMAAESILPGLGKGRWHRAGDMIVLSENRYHAAESRLEIEYTFIQQGKVETRAISTYCFTAAEISRMHAEAGLEVLELLDWYKHEPYQLGSRGLVVVSQRQR